MAGTGTICCNMYQCCLVVVQSDTQNAAACSQDNCTCSSGCHTVQKTCSQFVKYFAALCFQYTVHQLTAGHVQLAYQ